MTDTKLLSPRDLFGQTILDLAKSDPKVVVLSADLDESLRLTDFADQLPEQFFQVGVAEQNLVGISAGMALSGLIPFACSFAVFNPGRNWEQLRVSVCYANANVKIIGGHAGLSVGADGASHQALEDLALTRVLPNLTVIAPTDALETKKAILFAAKHQGPVYIRFGREAVPTVTNTETPLEYGKAHSLRNGSDLTIAACGPMVALALQAADQLEQSGISARVLAVPFIKPLDQELILQAAQETKRIITIEDAQAIGGLGSAIAEFVSEKYPVPVHRIGIQDRFGQSGTPDQLYQHYGLTVDKIIEAAQAMV